MAKRLPSDRNEVAVRERMAKEAPNTFTTDDGRVIQLKEKPDLIFIQQATNSVTYPVKPTYEVKVGTRIREYPIDEVVIEQTDDPLEKRRLKREWDRYILDLNEAINEQTKRATGAMFYEGTVAQEDFDDLRWEKKMKIAGWPVPADPEERWVFYLQTSLNEDEIGRLSTRIVLQSGGVSEEKIAAAQEMFRDNLQANRRPDDVEDADADEGGD